MVKYTARRLMAGLLAAFLVSLTLFSVLRVVPGAMHERTEREHDLPMMGLCSCGGEMELVTEYQLEQIRNDIGLQRPLHVQYIRWIDSWVTGYWGDSRFSPGNISNPRDAPWMYSKSAFETFKQRLPVTLQLVVMAQGIATLLGVSIGIIMAMKRNSRVDRLGQTVAKSGLVIPVIWGAALLLLAGLYLFNWSPRVLHVPLSEDPLGNLNQFLFPAITLAYAGCAAVALMMRRYTLDAILQLEYVQNGPASGLGHSVSVFLHTMRKALAPAIVVSGLVFPAIVGGVVIVEPIFGLEGAGSMLVRAAFSEDYPVVASLALFFSMWVIAANTLVDLIGVWLGHKALSTVSRSNEEWHYLAVPARLV